MKYYLKIAALLLLGFTSCKKESDLVNDLEKPTIETVYVNGEVLSLDEEGLLLKDSINEITIVFKDNDALSQASVNLHFVDGEHSHDEDGHDDEHEHDDHDEDDHGDEDHDDEDEDPFSYGPIIKDLSGKESMKIYSVDVPEHVKSGDYHLEILVTDISANKSSVVYTLEL